MVRFAAALAIRCISGISGSNTLAATDDGGATTGQLGFDDTITFSFAASNAFGFGILTSGPTNIFANDFSPRFGGATLIPDGSDGIAGPNGGEYFFGFVDTVATHTSAVLTFNVIGSSIAELDDVTISAPTIGPAVVPLPAGLVLLLTGIGCLTMIRRRAIT